MAFIQKYDELNFNYNKTGLQTYAGLDQQLNLSGHSLF